MDASINYLIRRAYTSPDVLLDARDLIGDQHAGVLLYRGRGQARYPVEPEPPRP